MERFLDEAQTRWMLDHLKDYIDEGDLQIKADIAEGTAGEIFTQDDGTMIAVGGLKQGTVVKGETAKKVLEKILFPYTPPIVSLSLTPSTGLYEVGSTIESIIMNVNVTKKSNDIQSIKFYVGETIVHTIENAETGSYSFEHSDSISANTTFKVIVDDGESETAASKTIAFTNYSYYGKLDDVASISADAISAQGKALVGNKGYTVTYNTSNEIMFYAIPSSFGGISQINDVTTGYKLTWSSINVFIDGVKYNVYYSAKCGVSNYKVKFI